MPAPAGERKVNKMTNKPNMPRFENYGKYSSDNYGAHTLVFTDARGMNFYYSYKTLVAFSGGKHGLVVHENVWGNTTGKHLNWIDGGDKKSRVSSDRFDELLADELAIVNDPTLDDSAADALANHEVMNS